MRWLIGLALACSLSFLSAPCWAEPPSGQASSSPSTGPLPAGSDGASSEPRPSWERLDDLLRRLESSAEASSEDSRLLKGSLEDARSRLSELSSRLSESATRANELSSSLERCEKSLELSEASLREARAAAGRRDAELWLWRGAAALGLAAGAVGLGFGLAR